ncbi:ribbon-helix-helix domain-containing protein [Romboutsia sp.]|uniref:ribbon-helix-helix domain-containing protein n=1 Tax=Romboutsia sp. TaxID=1965302 RepID=UPI003F3F4DBF
MINKEVSTRTSLTIPKELKCKLETLAKHEKRSVNNLIVYALDKYITSELNILHNKTE